MIDWKKEWERQLAEMNKKKSAKLINLGSGVYKFDKPKDPDNSHYMLAEECLVPNLNHSDKR